MAEVQVVSTTIVQAPPNPNSINTKIPLTCSDLKLILFGSIQKGLLFAKPESESTPLIQHLKSSLLQALQIFYPPAGRLYSLQHNDNTVSLFIDCNNAGAQFVHSVATNIAISDVLQPLYIPPFVASFFPLNEIRNCDGFSNPLLGIQITELSDGIFIGLTVNHCVADGTTFWNFVRTWSEISRGVDQISKPPIFDNWFRSLNVKFPALVLDTLDEFTPLPLQERIFHFSKENIARLKEKANAEAGLGNIVISSLQSVLAHLWIAVARNRETKAENDIRMMLPAGYRKRLKPEIPEGYFGNAVQIGTIALKAKQVTENGIGFVALELNKFVSGYTHKKIQNDIDSWIKDPKFLTLSGLPSDNLRVSSSPRFDVYGNDFGWGKPIAVRSGAAYKVDGKVTLFPGFEQGSIDVEVCLSPRVLQGLSSDSKFMNFVTV